MEEKGAIWSDYKDNPMGEVEESYGGVNQPKAYGHERVDTGRDGRIHEELASHS